MTHLDRTNAAYEQAGWTLRKGRMFVAFVIVGVMTGAGLGVIVGLILILMGLPNWIFVPFAAVAGGGGVYLGFARWHARYGGRRAQLDD